MNKLRILGLIGINLASCLWIQSCTQPTETTTQPATPSQNKLTISGSRTLGVIISDVAKSYEAKHPEIKIDVQSTQTWRGIADVRQATADIGMIGRSLKADEKELLSFTIARDGVTMVLHPSNPVKSLTDRQISDIYTKKISNWKQVGGKNAPIVVVSRGEGVGSLELFIDYFKLKANAIRADVIVTSSDESLEAVKANPNAISFASIGTAESRLANTSIKLMPIKGVAPSIINVSKGIFPVSRDLNLITKNPPSASAKEFIDFALSGEGQAIVKKNKFVSISP